MDNVADIIYRGPWYKNRGILALNLCLSLAILTSSVNGFDSSLLNGLQILPDWSSYFGNPSGSVLGLLSSAQNLGSLLGLPLAPFCTDGLGRRASIFVGSCMMLGGVILQATASEIRQFAASRALIGCGLAFTANASPLLISELAYPTQRGTLTALFNSSWYSGSILAAWATFATFRTMDGSIWSWRIPTILQGIPSLLQIALIWFIPESPRWLVAQGRDAEAIAILGKYHASGNERAPLVVFTHSQIREALTLEKEITNKTSYLSLFLTPGNRRRMRIILAIALFSQWSGNALISFYVNIVLEAVGIKDTQTKILINGGLQIWNLFMAVSAALLVEKIGRRPLFLTSNLGMLVAFSMITLTTALYTTREDIAAANATIGIIAIFFGFYDMAYTAMIVTYTVEILPFNIRAKGFAVLNMTICGALALNQFVNPIAIDTLGWKYYLVYIGWLCFEFFFVWCYLVETKGRTLEETAALFDGDGHTENLQNIGTVAVTQSLHLYPPMPKEAPSTTKAENMSIRSFRTDSRPGSTYIITGYAV